MRIAHSYLLSFLIFFLSLVGITAQPTANFSGNNTTGCSPFPLVVMFTDLSTGGATSWVWDFGDGSGSSTLQNPIYTYNAPGCYDVTLTVSDGTNNNTLTQTCFVEVFPQPNPDFSLDLQEGCSPLTVNFTDLSSPNAPSITDWLWILSDGSNSIAQNPSFTFIAAPDTINVILQVTNSNGCLATVIDTTPIIVLPPSILDFGVDINSSCSPPLTVTYTNNSLTNGANNYTFNWNFPGGSPSSFVGDNPPQVTYNADGQYDASLAITSQNGCNDTLVIQDIVGIGGVTASFTTSNTTICTGEPVTFTNTSTGGVTSLGWNFGENPGIDATDQTFTYIYNTPGTYSVTLQANNTQCGDTIVQSNIITVLQRPVADFTVNHTEDCQPGIPYLFNNQSTGASSVLWDFGDGTSTNTGNPAHTYNSFGTYDVCLIATNSQGCADTSCITITIEPPVADFDLNPQQGCAPLAINVVDQSSSSVDPITSWQWDFGSGTAVPPTSTLQNPQVTYQDSGSYSVSLIVNTASGCADTVSLNNIINVGEPPMVDFTVDKDTVCINEGVMFTSTFSNPTWEYFWDFNYMPPGAFSQLAGTVTTVYPDTGLFSIALIINNNGCRDTLIRPDLVYVSPPKALFSVSDTLVCSLPDTIVITEFSDGPIDIHRWEVNGQFYSSLQTPPPFAIDTIGTYLISQIVTNSLTGCSDTVTIQVNAGNPIADFSTPDTFGCRPHTANFTNLSQNFLSLQWKLTVGFLGGNFNIHHPTYTYVDTGKYSVQLIATDQFGCQDITLRPEYIDVVGVYADFRANPNVICPGVPTSFGDSSATTSSSTPVSWIWDFGDGSPNSFDQNPTHAYDSAGFYDVTLTVTDDQGCSDVLLKQNYIWLPVPVADFIVDDSSTCFGNNITITDTSQGTDLQYFWDFGDGVGTDTVANPSYTYADTGFFDISLIIENDIGCRDTIVKPNAVYIEPFEARFGGDPLVGICPPLSTQFADSSIGNIDTWIWTFGDQFGFSSLQDPAYVYLAPGTYTVSLTITHEDGCQDTLVKPDYVFVAGPNGNYTLSETDICVGDTVCVTAIADAATCASFDMRDGFFTTICGLTGGTDTTEFCYAYSAPGTFSPVVVLEDAQGCVFTLTSTDSISIHPHPQALIFPQDTAGCDPFFVPFADSSMLGDTVITSWIWDLGDMDSAFVSNPVKTYVGDTIYDISLIVQDGFGCSDSTTTTLTVYQGSIPDFVADDTVGCAPQDITFSDLSTNIPATAWTWIFGDGDTLSGVSGPTHPYVNDGLYTVTLIISDGLGCSDTLTKVDYIYLRHPQAIVYGDQAVGCNPVTLTFFADSSVVEDGVASYEWCLTNLATNEVICSTTAPNVDSLSVEFVNSGDYEMTLSIVDTEGCENTSEPFPVSIIARTIPPPLEVRNVSVVNDQSVEVSWTPYPGLDFVEYQIHRINGPNPGLVGLVSNINTTIFREDNPALDCSSNSYCYKVLVMNSCGEVSILRDTDEHCTIDLETTPNIDAIDLNWSAYVGYPVGQYEIYVTDSYTPITPPTLIGVVPGNILAYTDTNTFCYDSISYRVLAIGFNGQDQRSFSDIDANAPDHPLPSLSTDIRTATVVEDSFIVVNWSEYMGYLPDYYVLEKSGNGINWVVLDTFPLSIQTYTDTAVSVDNESYYYRVFAVDQCEDVSAEGYFGRSILLKAQLQNGKLPALSWSEYLEWPLGVFNYQIEIFNEETQEFELVDLVGNSVTSFIDQISNLNQDEYCYRIHAFEAGGPAEAFSNEVCIIFHSEFYIPNAFTPNNDGDNDVFELIGLSLNTGEVAIYNRWGEQIYHTFNLDDPWDGTKNGIPVPEGVYVYVVTGQGLDGLFYTRTGTVTLIR
ncbi:MAG: PKD domain-containing protein [Bacteroidota bacterium]